MLIDLPAKAKPSKVVSKPKQGRPHLQAAYVEERDGQAVLLATDSFKLLWLPLTVEGKVEPTHISTEALRAMEKTGRVEVGEYVEPVDGSGHANGVLFRKPEIKERPTWADLPWPEEPATKDKLVIGINATLLAELAQGMAAREGQLKLTIDLSKAKKAPSNGGRLWEKPMLVEPLYPNGARGLLMPVRVNV